MQNLRASIRALLAAPLALGLPMGAAHAAPQYILTDLGTLGGRYSNTGGLNEAGQVAGFSHLPGNANLHPFLWQEGLGLQALPTLGGSHAQALAVNDSGQVVGLSYLAGDTLTRAFIGRAGSVLELPTLGGANGRALSINGNGQVTGAAGIAGSAAEHAFVWQASAAQAPLDLGTLGGANSQGSDINASGQVAGYAENAGRVTHATLWSPPYGGAPQDLGTLGGTYSEAYGINASGLVVGVSTNTGDAQLRGFLWQPGTGMTDIGTLVPTSTETAAYDINSAGDVVGFSTLAGGASRRAIIRKPGAAIADLNGMILPVTGQSLTEARAINDAGQIVGIASRTFTDTATNIVRVELHGFLMTPDKVLPSITCPNAIRTTGNQPASLGTAIATDNLDPAPAVTNNAPAIFPNGDTTVTWTATDAAGNKSLCTQLITIAADSTPPIVAPRWQNTGLAATPNAAGWYSKLPLDLTWSVADTESAITSRVGCVNFSVTADSAATPAQSCTATSTGGTTGPVTASVKVDATAPTITPPAPVTADAVDLAGAVVTYPAPVLGDNLSGPDAASLSCTPATGSTFALGANPVNCTGKDVAGNTGTTSFTVTVRDPSPPVVTPTITGPTGNGGWFKGATSVSWSVTDGQSPITSQTGCDPVSFSADGASQAATCTAISSGGTTPVTATVNLDATPPSLGLSATTLVVEATGPSGATVIYPRTLADATSGPATPLASCAPESNTVMALGPTTVNCSGSDRAGNTATGSFAVSVVDTTAPTVTVPASFSVSTSDAGGAAVTYAASASDTVSGSLTPSCSAGTGSVFPVGPTLVTCSATDAAGNSGSNSFTVTVNFVPPGSSDTVAPVLTLPTAITVTAPDANGALVSYSASALDNVDGAIAPSCAPASGSLFAVGTTAVNCSVTDAAGNSATGSFNVTVNPPVVSLPTADLGLTVTESTGKREARLNRAFTYTFTVRNGGPGVAQSVSFRDVLPSTLRINSVSPSAGTCTAPIGANGGTVSCSLGNLANAGSATVRISVTPLVGTGSIVNSGSSSTASNDPNAANNTASITMTAKN